MSVNCALPTPALAQDATGSERQSDRLAEIVVTARKIEEPAQTVPQSLFVLTAEDLQDRSTKNLRDLQGLVPNLTLAPQQNVGEGSANIFIRGIGQEDFIAGSEQAVSVYIDGVYLSSTRGAMLNLLDVERIEVLRGPQGTLFGKNSVGGALQVISVAPQPRDEASIGATFGSFDRIELRGMANASLADNLLARLSLGWIRRDGYMRRRPPIYVAPYGTPISSRAEGAENALVGRLQLQWQAGERLAVHLAGDYARKRNSQAPKRIEAIDPAAGIHPFVNGLISTGALPGPRVDNAILPSSFYETLSSGKNRSDLDNWGLAATLDRDLEFGAAKVILAWRELNTRMGSDDDGTYFGIQSTEFIDRQRQFSAELQLSGSLGGIDFTTGLFSLTERNESLPAPGIRQGEVLYTCGCFYTPLNRPPQESAHRLLKGSSHAVFGQVVFDLVPRLRATLGARYTHDRKSIFGEVIAIDLDTLLPTGIVTETGFQRGAWGAFTWRAGLDWRVTPDVLLFASASKGFKSGGINARLALLPNLGLLPFAPETALTYELGLKSEWLGRRWRFNLTLFHSDYRNIQLRQLTNYNGIITRLVENAGAARIRGLEVEIEAKPIKNLSLRAAYGLIDAKYLDVGRVQNLTLDSAFQRTPRHSFSIMATYRLPLTDGALSLSGDFRYRSKEQFQLAASPYDQAGFGLLGARITYKDSKSGMSVALFSTNLLDVEYRAASRDLVSIVGVPRQFGVELRAAF